MAKVSVTRPSPTPVSRHSFRQSRRKLFITLAGFTAAGVIAMTSVLTVGALSHAESAPAVTSSTTLPTGGAVVLRWRVPHGQTLAPVVSVSGGAVQGQGGFNGVSCPTSSECVAVGADSSLEGVASTSSDGGNTWTQASMAANQPQLFAVDCPSASDCVAVGDGASARSTNGGVTWTPVSLTSANTTLLSVRCPTVTLCVSVGVSPGAAGPFGGQLLVSTNGGASWSSASLPPSTGALGSVDCPSATFCAAVGASIVVTTDGGKKWDVKGVDGGTGVLRSVSCESATSCVAIGPNPAVAQDLQSAAFEVTTTNGGTSWSSDATPPASATLDVVTCVAGSTCEAVGSSYGSNGSMVLSSADGGLKWSSLPAPASDLTGISAVSCPTANSCVYVGTRGATPVAVTANGNQVTTAPSVAPQVRTQKDLFR